MKKHWYKMYYWECPVCGRGGHSRERVYGEKPADDAERYDFQQSYDNCLEY